MKIEEVIEYCEGILNAKAHEYAFGDRFYNFKTASRFLGNEPMMALMGMAAKHIASVIDIREERISGDDMLKEKCGDLINYMILLYSLAGDDQKLYPTTCIKLAFNQETPIVDIEDTVDMLIFDINKRDLGGIREECLDMISIALSLWRIEA